MDNGEILSIYNKINFQGFSWSTSETHRMVKGHCKSTKVGKFFFFLLFSDGLASSLLPQVLMVVSIHNSSIFHLSNYWLFIHNFEAQKVLQSTHSYSSLQDLNDTTIWSLVLVLQCGSQRPNLILLWIWSTTQKMGDLQDNCIFKFLNLECLKPHMQATTTDQNYNGTISVFVAFAHGYL